MKPPTKFELMRRNRENVGLRRLLNDVDALIEADKTLFAPEPAVPTMEIDGVRYRESKPAIYQDCEGCAFMQAQPPCEVVNEAAQAAFGRDCYGGSGVIYIKAEA